MDMAEQHELASLRYKETMEAVSLWVGGQGENTVSPGEAMGIAKALMTHAALSIVAALPGCEPDDSHELIENLTEVVMRFGRRKLEDADD